MIEEPLKKNTGHTTKEETGIQMIKQGKVGTEVKVDREIKIGLIPGIEVMKGGVIFAESKGI